MPTFHLSPLAFAVAAALCPSANAADQNSQPLEEVIVTATKREVNVQDVGQSISVFTTADIEKRAFMDTEDFVRALPSVQLVNSRPGRNSIVMRGIGTGSEEFRTDSQVAVYLDEQPVTTISQQVDVQMIDIARVESLPGPQGTLFGSTSQTGTLRIITNRPDFDGRSGQIDAGIGTTKGGDESYDASGHVNIPLIDDTLAVRAVGFYSKEGGYVDNVLGPTLEGSQTNAALVDNNFNEYELYGGRISALWKINDKLKVDLSAIAQSDDSRGSWESDPTLGRTKITRFFDEYRKDDWYQVSMTLTADLGIAELTSTTSWFDRDISYEWDNMVYEQYKDAYFGPYYPLYNSEYTFGTIFNQQNAHRVAQEVRLASTGDSKLQWIVGGFYEDVNDKWFYGAKNPDLMNTIAWTTAQYYACYYNAAGYDVQCPLPPTDVGYSNTFHKNIKQFAVFGEVTYNFTDKWSVTGGARWFQFKRNELDNFQFPQGLPPAGSYDTGGSYGSKGTTSDVMLKFGTQYHFDEDRMVYFLYSEGYRLGGSNSARAAATGLIPRTYQPDVLRNYELGLKSQWLNNTVQFNATLFYMDWNKYQIDDFLPTPWWLRGTINGKGAESLGAELNGYWNVTENLSVDGSAFFADAHFTGNTARLDGSVVRDGDPLPLSPDTKLSLGVEYTLPHTLGGDWWFRYDYSYQSSTINTLDNVVTGDPAGKIPSWNWHIAQVGYDIDGGWEFSLTARNLFNDKAVDALYNDTAPALFGDPRYQKLIIYAAPRTITFNVRKRF